ncbi:exosortase-associated protein EpsI, B-type [Pelomonas sp. KK5]|uniref:exosortase-associated protein EpsI, B-type n=1 Tax=Pelomonas sp. KK5 TaxID=1855730 RepID=UPI00097BC27D|nr:exosortase-associated protein EpsI, B-type [Pelomonas sp. KK5]
MTLVRMRALLVMLCLAACAGLAQWIKPHELLTDREGTIDLETVFPKSFGKWRQDTSMPVSIVAPDVQAQLDKIYASVLSRTYVDDRGYRIMLSVAYGGDQSEAGRAHRPDVCYPAQGFQIQSGADSSVALPPGPLPVRHLVATLAERVEPITFWVAVGRYVALTGQEQKIAQLRYGLKGVVADGMLVRVSSIDRDTAGAFAVQTRFIEDMAAAFDPKPAARVFGTETIGRK